MTEDDVFDVGSVKKTTQFTRFLLNVIAYVQIKYNNKVEEAIHTVKKTKFINPKMPAGTMERNKEGKEINVKINEMQVFMWTKR